MSIIGRRSRNTCKISLSIWKINFSHPGLYRILSDKLILSQRTIHCCFTWCECFWKTGFFLWHKEQKTLQLPWYLAEHVCRLSLKENGLSLTIFSTGFCQKEFSGEITVDRLYNFLSTHCMALQPKKNCKFRELCINGLTE